jgi:voltage-gated potassium channel
MRSEEGFGVRSRPGPESDDASSWRGALQERVTAIFDIGLAVLALVLVGLIVLELAATLHDPWPDIVRQAQIGIWALFVIAFFIELALAPSVPRYLRRNWLVALSLVIPALRIFRVLHAIRVLRGARVLRLFNLARASAVVNRARGVLRDFFRMSQFAYLLVLTVIISIACGALVYAFETAADEATITSFGDGVWWAGTTVTTISAQMEPVTLEGRMIALFLRIFGLVVIGYLTATIAVFLLGKRDEATEPAKRHEMELIRDEIRRLRETLERRQ